MIGCRSISLCPNRGSQSEAENLPELSVDQLTGKLSCIMRKLNYCMSKNKDTDQLCSSCTADQHLCFCLMDSTINLLLKYEYLISSFQPTSMTIQPSLCQNWSETGKTCFLETWLN